MSDAIGHTAGEPCDTDPDMITATSLAPETPAPHPARCSCCVALDDALAVIASLKAQLAEATACIHGCTDDMVQPRCPVHGTPLR